MIFVEHTTDFEFYSSTSAGAIQGDGYIFHAGMCSSHHDRDQKLRFPQLVPPDLVFFVHMKSATSLFMILLWSIVSIVPLPSLRILIVLSSPVPSRAR